MLFILPLLYCILFVGIIIYTPFFKKIGISSKIILGIFGIKILAAFALHYIYTYYYPIRIHADIFKYFDDAQVIWKLLPNDPLTFFKILANVDLQSNEVQDALSNTNFWNRQYDYGLFNDNRTMIRVNALITFFSWGNIFVHHIFSAFLSLVGYTLIYKVFKHYFPKQSLILILGIFLMPSSLFWASAMLKECVVMLGLGLFIYATHSLVTKPFSYTYAITCAIGIFILSIIKLYVLAALLPATFAFILSIKYSKIASWKFFIGTYGLLLLAIIINQYLEIIPFLETLSNKRNDFITDAIYYKHARSYISIGFLDSNGLQFIIETPIALARATFLPLIWSIQTAMEILPALESILLVLLLLLLIFFYKPATKEQQPIIWFTIFYSILTLWFIGMSTPVVGAIVRYKTPILPFIYPIFALVIDWNRLQKLCISIFRFRLFTQFK